MDPLKQNVISYFENCLAQHGDSPLGVDYNGRESQFKRFEILADVADLNGKSVHDVGCGLGHFFDYLKEQSISPVYSGSDISPAMIAQAKKRHPGIAFEVRDLLDGPAPLEPRFDYVTCCGVFHLKAENDDAAWEAFAFRLIERMYQFARHGIAFNMMTDQVDFKVDRLFYADPMKVFDFCRKNLSRRVLLRHDYPLYEFSTYVYR